MQKKNIIKRIAEWVSAAIRFKHTTKTDEKPTQSVEAVEVEELKPIEEDEGVRGKYIQRTYYITHAQARALEWYRFTYNKDLSEIVRNAITEYVGEEVPEVFVNRTYSFSRKVINAIEDYSYKNKINKSNIVNEALKQYLGEFYENAEY